MQSAIRPICLLAAAVAFYGCTPVFEDASNVEPYKSNLGRVCTSNLALQAHGVAKTVEREKKTDYVLVTELNLTGPEFTFAAPLPVQTTIRLDAAQTCNNCYLEGQAHFAVTVSPPVPEATGVPVYVRAKAVSSGVMQCK
jgi:hypothetical protein